MTFPLNLSIEKIVVAMSLASSKFVLLWKPVRKLYVIAGLVSTSFADTVVKIVPISVPIINLYSELKKKLIN